MKRHCDDRRRSKIGRVLWRAGVVLLLAGSFAGAKAATRWEILQAIHWVENPTSAARPGPGGELGAYQFRPETWSMHTDQPFSAALDRRCSDAVAVRHFEWLKTRLERAGFEASPYNIALAWNAGLNAVLKNQAPAASHNYAGRVHNLATELTARRLARTH